MARIPKFIYVMILFVSLFLIVVDVCGELIIFFNYFIIIVHPCLVIFFLFFVTGKCNSDAECRERWIMCPLETVVKCVEDECICVH